MFKSNRTSKSNYLNDNDNQLDSDSSLGKDEDLNLSSSSSSSSSSSPTTISKSSQPKKIFLKKLTPNKDSLKFNDEFKLNTSDENDPFRSGLRRPLNPIAKADKRISDIGNSLESTVPDKKDETPFSTMKFGSDTLDEEQEKAEFFRNLEQNKGENKIDYGVLNQQIELDLSPERNGRTINSFNKQINQMSTPLHLPPNDQIVKESLTNELDREIEHEMQKLNTTTTIKHVTIVEPTVRPTVSFDDFSRTNKTVSDCLSSTSETTRDLTMLHNAYKQNLHSVPTSRTHTVDTRKKIPSQKSIISKTITKPNIQTPTKKTSPSPTIRSKPISPKDTENKKDAALIEQLKIDKELLNQRIESLQTTYDEQLRSIRQENYLLQAKISQLTNIEGKNENLPPKQREIDELEKLLDSSQNENEKLCKQIKHLEQQHKQIQKSMFDENEKLRQELIQTKMFLEQQNSISTNIKKQSSTIILTDLIEHDQSNENQRLKNEIYTLKDKLSSVENKTNDTFEQRRIKDLERQVKELEIINRRYQQNSITQVGMVLNPLDDRKQLEIKLIQAEQTLNEREKSEEKLRQDLNILEEKYILMKQIYTNKNSNSENFERELHQILNQNKTINLRRENERLKSELKIQQIPKPAKSLKRDLETIKLLRTDLERKNDQLEKLRALYDAVNVQHKSLLAEREREKTRLAMMGNNKPYQPDRFTQMSTPIEMTHEENKQLKHLVEKLEQDVQEQHMELIRLRDDRQTAINTALKQKDDEISRLRQQHKSELQTVINEMSMNTNETRISDLHRKIQSQDATILHLKKLTEQNEENTRELTILRVQDEELKSNINRLEQELVDARAYHTPEMKHFQELQNKIHQLEQRWSKREQITKDYANSLIKQHEIDTNNDINKLRAIIKQKNQEIERFHLELDSMLELLKTLKFQQLLYHP